MVFAKECESGTHKGEKIIPKLVRDLIPEIIENSGRKPNHSFASDEEMPKLLQEKLKEEVQEFVEAKSMEELADILEVIESIYEVYKFDKAEVNNIRIAKALEKGAFKNKIILNSIE